MGSLPNLRPLFSQGHRAFGNLASAVIVLAVLFLLSPPAYADPITWLKGEFYLTKHGNPYRGPARLTSNCYYGYGSGGYINAHENSALCLNYGCTVDVFYNDGVCDLTIETIGEEPFVLNDYLGRDLVSSVSSRSEGMWPRFEAEIDLGTGTHRFGKPGGSGLFNSPVVWFLAALLVAIGAEVLTLLLLRYLLELDYIETKKLLVAGTIASLVTLPVVWFLPPQMGFLVPTGVHFGYCIGVIELLVIIAEAGIYRWVLATKMPYALLLSAAANAVSFLAGLLLL